MCWSELKKKNAVIFDWDTAVIALINLTPTGLFSQVLLLSSVLKKRMLPLILHKTNTVNITNIFSFHKIPARTDES